MSFTKNITDAQLNSFKSIDNNDVWARRVTISEVEEGKFLPTSEFGTPVNIFGEVLAIAVSATEQVSAYTIPVEKIFNLTQVDIETDNRATVTVKKNNQPLSKKNTWWGAFNLVFSFDLLPCVAGDAIQIEVKNNSAHIANLYYNLQGRMIDAITDLSSALLLENGNPLLQENGNIVEV